MKRILLIGVVAVALGVAVFTTALYMGITRPPKDPAVEPVQLTVPPGQAFTVLVDRLAENGLLANPWAVRVYASMRGYDRLVKQGTYRFEPGEAPLEILGRLISGDVLKTDVTIPEGYNIWDIAGAFREAAVDSAELLSALSDREFLERRRIEAPTLEGYLFPDTYRVRWGASPGAITTMMLARLDEVFDASLLERSIEIGMRPHEVLTLASIIEAETRVPDERTRVAAVYHNRLRRGMRLEADPTVAYAMGGYKGRLLYADLEIDSPYNTYRRRGLPPGPICSPGRASILAALYPDSSSSDLYFVARGDGTHIFSRTLREHNNAVQSVRKNRKRNP